MTPPRFRYLAPGFETERLSVARWPDDPLDTDSESFEVEAASRILTPPVLAHLPPSMQLGTASDALKVWIGDRDAESDVFTVSKRSDGQQIGYLILGGDAPASAAPEIHVGYLLAETAWGRGYGTELLRGLVAAIAPGNAVTLVGGVNASNQASARVLEKAGFLRDADNGKDVAFYRRVIP